MELILVRHAKAFDRDASAWPDDSRRPLTAEGREQFARFAKRLRHVVPNVDLVESSGFVRAWQTAMLLEEHARWPKPARLERLEARDNLQDEEAQLSAMLRTIAALRAIPVVVWLGHEPSLSRFASLLLAGSADAIAIEFRKGAALSLEIESSPARDDLPRARFRWMLTPNVARRITKR